jgi:hypothetical protein
VEGCRERYSSDNDCPTKFGAAAASQVLLSDGIMDSRNILKAQHVLKGPTLVFPASSFKLLVRTNFTKKAGIL